MAILTEDQINEVRNSVDIVEIIGAYIPLTQKGRNFFGVCPFHDDHNPSMSVSREKQIYKCFSCGASGNVFNFLMEYEHMDFREALVYLANKSGIKLMGDIFQTKKKDINEKLYEIYNISTKYYQNNINTSSGSKARTYLKNRNIDDNIINEFQIGLALNKKDALTKLLLSKDYKEKELVDSGISNKGDAGFQDVFIDRIIFPLWDITGQVIGYSGRIYNESDMAKYVNTKETNIFKKGMMVYIYHRAKDVTRIKKQVIIVEGFMDVIRLYSVGIDNVIAIMGTSITEQQIRLIKKLSNNIIICFDGDDAGANATLTCGNELTKIGINPKIIRLEDNLDPDEYITKYSKDKFLLAIDNAQSFIDFKLNYYRQNKDLKNNDDITKYINEVILEVSTIEDEIKRDLILSKINEEFSVSKDILINKLNKYLTNKKPIINKESIDIKKATYESKYQKAEKRLLYYMLKSAEIIKIYENKIAYLPTANCRILANEIIAYSNKYGNINIADFITHLRDQQELIELIGELEMEHFKDEYSMEEINDYIKTIREYSVKDEIKRLTDLMKNEIDVKKQVEYAEAIRKLRIEE